MLTDILRRLQGEVALVERATAAERERIAHLAHQWGHTTFAAFIRNHKPCSCCHDLGYDASGQVCGCQFKDD